MSHYPMNGRCCHEGAHPDCPPHAAALTHIPSGSNVRRADRCKCSAKHTEYAGRQKRREERRGQERTGEDRRGEERREKGSKGKRKKGWEESKGGKRRREARK